VNRVFINRFRLLHAFFLTAFLLGKDRPNLLCGESPINHQSDKEAIMAPKPETK
jgi:hypothetical protein